MPESQSSKASVISTPRPTIMMAVAAVALCVTASACGGTSTPTASSGTTASASPTGVAAKTYASTVCSALVDWGDSVQRRTQAFTDQSKSIKNLPQAKESFVAFIDGTLQDTTAMIQKVQATGPPAVPNGAEIHTKVVDALRGIETSLSTATSQAQALNTTNAVAFSNGVRQIVDSLNTTVTNAGDPLADVSSPQLEAAGNSDPDCQELNSQG